MITLWPAAGRVPAFSAAARTAGATVHRMPAPLVQWQGYVIDSGAAWLKSTEILVRGMNIWNAALLGVVSMSLDDRWPPVGRA